MLQPPSRDTIVHLVQNRRVHELSATQVSLFYTKFQRGAGGHKRRLNKCQMEEEDGISGDKKL